MNHIDAAVQAFLEGYNCAQAVAVAFSDVTGLDKDLSARLASPFGGGMGRMREVCGAVSGMLLVVGILYGYDDPKATTAKRELYTQVQEMAGAFRAENGSIICRDLLKNPSDHPNPSPRTAEYYQTRPCVRMVETAARILEEYIKTHPMET